MEPTRLRTLAHVGVALAFLGVLVPGFHHVRCEAVLEGSGADMACAETFPASVAFGTALIGVVGALVALAAALRLGDRRVFLGLAAVALLVPAATVLAGWSAVGFDLALASGQPDGGSSCTGTAGIREMPLWLQTPTCLGGLDLVRVPILFLAGLAATLGAMRLDRRALLAGLALGATALAALVGWLAIGAARLDVSWALPALGVALLAAAARMRAQPEVPAA